MSLISSIGASNVSMGGVSLLTSEAFILRAECAANAAQIYSKLLDSTGANYQVPAGKTLRIHAIVCRPLVAYLVLFGICYGDTVATNSTTAPTNNATMMNAGYISGNADEKIELPLGIDIPAQKFPNISSSGSSTQFAAFFLCSYV